MKISQILIMYFYQMVKSEHYLFSEREAKSFY